MSRELELYPHNINSYNKIDKAYKNGERVVGIVHATGTGKSYNALKLAIDNKDKNIIYVVPSNGIIEHLKNIVISNDVDISNINFRTYQSFLSLSRKDIKELECDLLILDEFHHIGAPIWGDRINTLINTHPNMKIFGMTAYTVRDRGSMYERDLASDDDKELFSNKIVSRYDLCDAMIDGVLPKPVYKSSYANLDGLERKISEKVSKLNRTSSEYLEYMKILSSVRKRIHEAPSIPNILKKNIKSNGKYIYFCPPYSEDGTNDIETIKKQAMEWFREYIPSDDIVFYTSVSDMDGKLSKLNRDSFYSDKDLEGNDASNKLRIMFAINQYNEGIHAPNVDGVIMGRGTSSDIVYFEQLGRALSVRDNINKEAFMLSNYSYDELIDMCNSRDIKVKDSYSREELISKLLSPIIIDLADNYKFIKELETRLKDRIKLIKNSDLGEQRVIKISDASFDIEMEDQDLFEMLCYVQSRVMLSWNEIYEYAKIYYEHYGNLEVPSRFRTNDGYTLDKDGRVRLGEWIIRQRENKLLSSERKDLLLSIGMRFNNKRLRLTWNEMYEYAKIYYEHHNDLEVPFRFRTSNGYIEDNEGKITLGNWIHEQRVVFNNNKLSEEKANLLLDIGMRFNNKNTFMSWDEMYEYAKIYYEHYGNIDVIARFDTNDGYTKDDKGKIHLGAWISRQRTSNTLSDERRKLLLDLGMRFENKNSIMSWNEMYEYAKIYYEHYGNLEVAVKFRTNDGYTEDINGNIHLGSWISYQRRNKSLSDNKKKLLLKLGMRFENKNTVMSWDEMYKYAKIYYEHYGNLEVSNDFKTNDGYTEDKNGKIHLGGWIFGRRNDNNKGILSEERKELLLRIGMRFDNIKVLIPWNEMYEYAKIYYEHYGNLNISKSFDTNDGYTKDLNGKIHLGKWISRQRQDESLSYERRNLLLQIGMRFDNIRDNKNKIDEVCNKYKIDKKINNTILKHISIQELVSKIEYLNSKNITIYDSDGILNNIFNMSSIEMKKLYGISLDELIIEYYINNNISKGR